MKVGPYLETIKINDSERLLAEQVLTSAGIDGGFALVQGEINVDLLAALAENSTLRIYQVVEAGHLDSVRHRLDAAGLYGTRITLHKVSLNPLPYIDYFADLIVAEGDICRKMKAEEMYRVLRPYGGAVVICCSKKERSSVIAWLEKADLENVEFATLDIGIRVVRGAPAWCRIMDPSVCRCRTFLRF